MQARPHVCEEIVDMSDHYAKNLILWNATMHEQAEPHQDPREIWGGEDKQAEKAEASIGVPSGPDVHKHT